MSVARSNSQFERRGLPVRNAALRRKTKSFQSEVRKGMFYKHHTVAN